MNSFWSNYFYTFILFGYRFSWLLIPFCVIICNCKLLRITDIKSVEEYVCKFLACKLIWLIIVFYRSGSSVNGAPKLPCTMLPNMHARTRRIVGFHWVFSRCRRAAHRSAGVELSLLPSTPSRDGIHHLRQHGLSRRAPSPLLSRQDSVSLPAFHPFQEHGLSRRAPPPLLSRQDSVSLTAFHPFH